MKILLPILAVLVLAGCSSNRSVSFYGHGYNPSYLGELSQIGFIKDVADPAAQAKEEHFNLPEGARLMVIQSGQAFPDDTLLRALPPSAKVLGISGNPEIGAGDRIPLRSAARNGNVDFILAYWGTVRTSSDDEIGIVISAILANVREGTWKHIEVRTASVAVESSFYSFFNPQAADDRQVQQLKAEVYGALVKRIYASEAL